ncbi:hypothetical protein ETB97_005568 [Aspergillus alliaceus]|uniref:Uncharacterized protein n=1 Tax=Petromyces alliaceus TaxID=209559 RepID=A0A8H6AFH2_PETAA|nr:hypothetical protein ETB97_005568 [Aspergillus burnettii]
MNWSPFPQYHDFWVAIITSLLGNLTFGRETSNITLTIIILTVLAIVAFYAYVSTAIDTTFDYKDPDTCRLIIEARGLPNIGANQLEPLHAHATAHTRNLVSFKFDATQRIGQVNWDHLPVAIRSDVREQLDMQKTEEVQIHLATFAQFLVLRVIIMALFKKTKEDLDGNDGNLVRLAKSITRT